MLKIRKFRKTVTLGKGLGVSIPAELCAALQIQHRTNIMFQLADNHLELWNADTLAVSVEPAAAPASKPTPKR